MAGSESTARCWICLGDETADEVEEAGMIAPCACVGTNQWVHESCLKTYCLQYLATHAASSPSLRVACPICKTDYQITARGSSSAGWLELLRWSSTDEQLLLRHARFFFLVAPLVGSSLVAASWLGNYWEDFYRNGSGELLMENVPSNEPIIAAATVKSALVWLPYAQWYKVLCWLMVLVLGGSEGLLPSSVREAFRVEELLLASETRAQVFIFGQCLPFVLTKTRHFLVTWAGSSWLVRLVFYSFFTSHVEVAATLVCDCIVAIHLLNDWASSVSNDYKLRLNLNRLRSGYFQIASLQTRRGAAARHAHRD